VSVPVIAFFNNKGGVGKTTLVYHLAWMFADLGVSVLAADLDPQANLTAAFIEEDIQESFWGTGEHDGTIYQWIQPLLRGTGDIAEAYPIMIVDDLFLMAGDLLLSGFEDELSSQWPRALGGEERAFRVQSALWRVMQDAATRSSSRLILMDLGPNLGAINRAALLAADHIVVPLAPDLFSLQGLRNLGPAFKRWRRDWQDRLDRKPEMVIGLPAGQLPLLGYVVQQHSVRLDRPVKAYDKWIHRIPGDYREFVLSERRLSQISVENDPYSLGMLKHYRSLMPMAQEARKPMFHLKPADGAIGAHLQSAEEARKDFEALAKALIAKAKLPITLAR
jgi:cellulose biosynthesis protein BcsQ